jgi:hypothetical protein
VKDINGHRIHLYFLGLKIQNMNRLAPDTINTTPVFSLSEYLPYTQTPAQHHIINDAEPSVRAVVARTSYTDEETLTTRLTFRRVER